MSNLIANESPTDTLDRLGINPGAKRSLLEDGKPCFDIFTRWLSVEATRDLAYLIAEGWSVSIQPVASRTLKIRLIPKDRS